MPDLTAVASGSAVAFLIAWMTMASIVSLLLAAVAAVAERLLRSVMPARWIWAGAMVGALAFSISQPWRRAESAQQDLVLVASVVDAPADGVRERSMAESLMSAVRGVTRTAAALSAASTALGRRAASLLAPAANALLISWPLASLLLGALLTVSYRRQFRRASAAPTAMVGSHPVRLSDNFGPAVVGVRAPLIVMPRWLLHRSSREQHMVVAHEQSHVAAHDPLLLLASCLAVVLLPWNLPLWYMASRLRLAIELDCDARVLAGGGSRRHYGQLLIELSAAPTSTRGLQGVPAFSYRASHLERRLHTMTARPARFPVARRVVAGSLAACAVLAACRAELPTAADVEALDAAAAGRQLTALTGTESPLQYFVDDVEKSRAEAESISPERIARIDVIRASENGTRRMYIRTAEHADGGTASASAPMESSSSARRAIFVATPKDSARVALTRDSLTGERVVVRALAMRDSVSDSLPRLQLRATNVAGLPDPLVIIDGKRGTFASLRDMPPDRIQSVEVVKAAAAQQLYGADGANGVIIVTSRR